MAGYHLAQINIGRIKGPLDGPVMAGFMVRLDEINALAEQSPGFVWRLQTYAGNATDLRPYEDDRILLNMSVWETVVAVALNPIFLLVIVFMAAQLVNWLKVLDHADLSYAKPFTSLSYVTVCGLSVLLLGEHVAPMQIVGIVVVIAGVWCVSMTRPATLGSGAEPE